MLGYVKKNGQSCIKYHHYAFWQTFVRPRLHRQFRFPHLEGSGPVTTLMAAKRLIRGQENTSYEEILKKLNFVD